MHYLISLVIIFTIILVITGLVIILIICGQSYLRCVNIGLGLADRGLRTSRPAYDIDRWIEEHDLLFESEHGTNSLFSNFRF